MTSAYTTRQVGSRRCSCGRPCRPGGTCAGKPCWKATATGFKYTNKDLTPNGVKTMQLKAGTDGKATVKVKGQGGNLGMPALPLAPTVTVQLKSSDGGGRRVQHSAPRPRTTRRSSRRKRTERRGDRGAEDAVQSWMVSGDRL